MHINTLSSIPISLYSPILLGDVSVNIPRRTAALGLHPGQGGGYQKSSLSGRFTSSPVASSVASLLQDPWLAAVCVKTLGGLSFHRGFGSGLAVAVAQKGRYLRWRFQEMPGLYRCDEGFARCLQSFGGAVETFVFLEFAQSGVESLFEEREGFGKRK